MNLLNYLDSVHLNGDSPTVCQCDDHKHLL
jgi:hypothetical protein